MARHRDQVRLLTTTPDSFVDVDVLLFDPSYADASTMARLRSLTRHTCVVGIGWDDTSRSRHLCQALGACGYVSLRQTSEHLLAAIETAHRGGPPSVRPVVPVESRSVDGAGDTVILSAREVEIISLICRGLTNDEIARELYLSINSIKTYIRSAYRKVGVSRRSQVVNWGIRNGY